MDFKVEAKFQANSLKELRQQIMDFMAEEGFDVGYTIAVSAEPVAEKPKATRAAKQEAKVETAPLEPATSAEPEVQKQPTETVDDASTSAESVSSPSTDITYEDVRAAVLALAAKKGRDDVLVVLGKFGYEKANQASEDEWPAIIAAAQEAM